MTADSRVLQQVPLFRRVPVAELATLAQRLMLRKYRAGQVIFHQGDPGTSFYLIELGRVKIVVTSEEGEELLLAILDSGDFFGELALLDGHPRSATAVALADTQTYTLGRDDFSGFLRSSPKAAIAVCTALAERVRYADERLAESAFLDVRQRLRRRLLSLAETYGRRSPQGIVLDLPLSQRELAELIGATRQRVNKVLSQWQQAGILQLQRRSLVIRRPDRLRDLFL